MKVCVVIPWKASPSRIKLLDIVLAWYKTNLPDIDIIFANASEEIWLASASRNMGVKRAQEAGYEVIIINDADTLPEIKPLLEAIEACKKDNKVHNPYTHCKIFSEKETDTFISGIPIEDIYCQNVSVYSNGGIYVCTPDAWWGVGGMDEKFIQWGYEDSAFEVAHEMILGVKLIKHSGNIYSLKHNEQFHDVGYRENENKNRELYIKYLNTRSRSAMLDLVKQNNY